MKTNDILALTLDAASTTHKKTPVVLEYRERPSAKKMHADTVVQLGYAVRMPQLGDKGELSEKIETARMTRTGIEMIEVNDSLDYAPDSEPTVGDLVNAHCGDAFLRITEAPENADIEIYA